MTLRIMSYNILDGGTGRLDPLFEVIAAENPDIVLVQETWETAVFEKLAIKLNMEIFQAQSPQNPRGHVGVLSRYSIRKAINYGPLEPRLTRAAAMVTLATPEGGINCLCVHLHPYPTPADEAVRLREIDVVLDIAKATQGEPVPMLIAGDFNSLHPAQLLNLQALDERNRERIGNHGGVVPRLVVQKMLDHGWVDTHAVTRTPQEFATTFTTAFPAMRVDYIFVSAALVPRIIDCYVVKSPMAHFASDHFPIVLNLR